MALNDFLQRLQGISGEGSRETDFQLMKNQRGKSFNAALNQIRLQAQRNMQFNGTISGGNIVGGGNKSSGGVIDGSQFGGSNNAFQYPLHGKLRVSSPYGVERKGHKVAHTGIDWAEPAGTPIYSPGAGKVVSTLFDKIYGNQTIIDYGGGKKAMFGHQSGFANIKPGQTVAPGQLIGYVGSTGWSTGPHLHFQTWIGNQVVNPLSWFM